jgi:hypothetical protein
MTNPEPTNQESTNQQPRFGLDGGDTKIPISSLVNEEPVANPPVTTPVANLPAPIPPVTAVHSPIPSSVAMPRPEPSRYLAYPVFRCPTPRINPHVNLDDPLFEPNPFFRNNPDYITNQLRGRTFDESPYVKFSPRLRNPYSKR